MTTSTSKITLVARLHGLATREAGAKACAEITDLLALSETVEIDFSGLEITPSFADECVGKLAAVMGLTEFKKRVLVRNVPEASKHLIKHVIARRCLPVAA